MSSQKGNAVRCRPQKYKNATKFQNDKYDCSRKTKAMNNLKFESLCNRCESIIQWKIKYKKYKALTVPTKCIKCEQKTVKAAYHTICRTCAEALDVCSKCGEHWKKEQEKITNEEDETSE